MADNDTILSSRGKPFTTKVYAEKSLPAGYVAIEQDGGWVGVLEDDTPVVSDKEPLDVICPGCGQSYHETTNDYNPAKAANAAMLILKSKFRAWGWEEIIPDKQSGYGCLVCPDCGAALAPTGNLRVKGAYCD